MINISQKLIGIRCIELPKSWKHGVRDNFINFMIFDGELTKQNIIEILKYAKLEAIVNPRPITKKIFEYASILHPRLFYSAQKEANNHLNSLRLQQLLTTLQRGKLTPKYKILNNLDLTQEYYNSLLFLAGCTLSASIIQNRYAAGTIDSKLNRLWQFLYFREKNHGTTPEIERLKEEIIEIGNTTDKTHIEKLLVIKKLYSDTFQSITHNTSTYETRLIQAQPLPPDEQHKFDFVEVLNKQLGSNLIAVFVYGSSITSKTFNDYDVIIVVDNEQQAFQVLKGTNPSFNGFDINLSVYSKENFKVYQIYSGDNLDTNVKCLYGEIEIPVKRNEVLVLRNFSFAIIRLRQLLGMASFLSQEGKHFGLTGNENIYHYFIKIPMHIAKGVGSAYGKSIDKETINMWTLNNFNYDIKHQMQLCEDNRTWEAISNAYIATLHVMDALNKEYNFIKF